MGTGLPFGRGQRTGANAFVAQQESYRLRRTGLPNRFSGSVSLAQCEITTHYVTTSNTFTVDILYLVPMYVSQKMIRIKEAALNVTTGTAVSSTLAAAIYLQDVEDHDVVTKIAGSEVEFSTENTAVVTRQVRDEGIEIPSGQFLFMGFVLATAVPTVAAGVQTSSPVPGRTLTPATSLPNLVKVSTLATDHSLHCPWVVWLSHELAEVL